MHTDYHGFLSMPLSVIGDYLTVMAGESEGQKPPQSNPMGVPADAELEWID